MPAQTWPAATTQASVLASDWFVFAVAGLAVAVLVWGLILFAVARWRRRDSDAAPPQFRNNYPLEITWTLIPLALVCGLFVYTYGAEARVEALSPHPDVTVTVTGYRWGWLFQYAGGPTIGGAAGAPVLGGATEPPPQMVLPLGEITRIEITSVDVNHAFWVPAFLFKRDAIPGQTTAFDLQPEKLGTYLGRCAEFCGLDHALMTFTVRVVTPDEFQRWRRGATTP
ncbi:MAG TPA: cytochrome c oxidase subunit II [Candidatus Acidoferrales bacterium]|nr:cytochrome c oxidase subunit II [Candidatus Acidoferrales bacterium]